MEPLIGQSLNPAATAKSAVPIDVNSDQFVTEVLDGSMEQPIVVDFWAPWCGPCKALTPLIEKVINETRGAVRLVKVDIDKNKELAAQMRIQSIPAVYGFFGGKPLDGFVGALPESQIRAFVQRLLKTAQQMGANPQAAQQDPLAQAMDQAAAMVEVGDLDGALALYEAIVKHDPNQFGAWVLMGRLHLALGNLAAAKIAYAKLPSGEIITPVHSKNAPQTGAADLGLAAYAEDIVALKTGIELAELAAATGVSEAGAAALEAQIAADATNFQARYDLSLVYFSLGEREAAIDQLLEIMRRNRAWNDDAARKQLLKLIEAMGASDPLTLETRKRMSKLLFA